MQDGIWRRLLRRLGLESPVEDSKVKGAEPETIRQVEAQGYGWEILPTNTNGHDAEFTDLGFVFGKLITGDPLYRATKLPLGWTYEWAERKIVDETGASRVQIQRKDTPYDRFAKMYLVH